MMSVPKSAFDVRREANAGALTAIERIALECIKQAAREGRAITNAELCAAIGTDNVYGGTGPGVLKRLETKGYISRETYQRGVRICIPALGICTAEPANTAPHWRNRAERIPSPAIHSVTAKAQSTFQAMEADARARGVSIADHLADLAYIGHHEFQRRKEGADE